MSARIYQLPTRDRHVSGERPDWASSRDYRRGVDAGYKLGFDDGKDVGERHGAIVTAAFYAVMKLVAIAGFAALGVHP